jgi:thiamine pyrophosphate-dependent acetolactate synthase large subunit-like protein
VKRAFGVPSGPVLPLIEALRPKRYRDRAFAQDSPTVVEAFIDSAPYSQTVND